MMSYIGTAGLIVLATMSPAAAAFVAEIKERDTFTPELRGRYVFRLGLVGLFFSFLAGLTL